jgi:hypothetical protein
MLVLPVVGENHMAWLILPLLALLLVALDTMGERYGLVLLAGAVVLTLYLGYPDLHDANVHGYAAAAEGDTLPGDWRLLLHGPFLYGTIALNFFLVFYIQFIRRHHGNAAS